MPDNDASPAPFGVFAPNAAQAAIVSLAHRSGLKRGAFRPWLSRLINLVRDGPLDVSYQGASFRLYHQNSATERGALLNPDYNLEELNFLRAHTPTGGVFVDVGANVGTYALVLARKVGTTGKVIAIEPHPVTHARLSFNCAASGLTQVILVAAAAGPVDGEVLIETDGDNLGASHVVSSDASAKAIRVPSFRLIRILEQAGAANIDALKIDQSFIRDLTTDTESATISAAIIDLAHRMQVRVIAEGVETQEQLSYLRSLECDEIQGYYFSRPLSSTDFETLMLSDRRLPAEKTA